MSGEDDARQGVVDRMSLASADLLGERVDALRELFPEAFAEGKVDLERLRVALGGQVDEGRERYGLTWAGKAEAMRGIQVPSTGTLLPVPAESVDFDTSENVFIEGDNLEVLKLLQKSYYGKVKLIYIDPPYNTGNEFIYPDNFREGLQDYLRYSGQVDGEGIKLSTNTETDGRFHSKWLSMMWPRLFLARNLLRRDGVLLASIDDHEVFHLRLLLNEVFGEENMLAELVWEKTRKNDAKFFSVGHEYMLVYARDALYLRETDTIWREAMPGAAEIQEKYEHLKAAHGGDCRKIEADLRAWYRGLPDGHPAKLLSRYKSVDEQGVWRDRDISWPGPGGPRYEVPHPVTRQPCAVPPTGWRFATPEEMARQIKAGLVVFREDHTKPPIRKAHLTPRAEEGAQPERKDGAEAREEAGLQVMPSVIYRQAQVAAKYLRALLGADLFDNPKDHEVIGRLVRYCTHNGDHDIVLDFFAGSGTTADAVLRENARDNGSRRFVLVQLPEPVPEGTPARLNGFTTISEIARTRIRRVLEELVSKSGGRYWPRRALTILASRRSGSPAATSRSGTARLRPVIRRSWPSRFGCSRTTSSRAGRSKRSCTNWCSRRAFP